MDDWTNQDRNVLAEDMASPAEQERLPLLSWLVGLFLVCAVTVAPLETWNIIVKIIGVILAGAYVMHVFRSSARPSPEVIVFALWVSWSVTGAIFAISSFFFYRTLGTVFQLWLLTLIVAGFTTSRKILSFNLICFLFGVSVVAGYSILTGDYAKAEGGEERLSGLALNANAFGWLMNCAVFVMMYIWTLPTRHAFLKYLVLVGGFSFAAYSVMLSGSRTGIICMGVLFIAWWWFVYRKEILRRPFILIVAVSIILLASLAYMAASSESVAQKRFSSMFRIAQGETSHEGSIPARLRNYVEGVDIFWQYPVTGVGLNNFRVHVSTGLMAHSEYFEVLCDTGIPGFLLYFAIFMILWRRTGKIIKYSSDPREVQIGQLVRAFIVTLMASNFVLINYNQKPSWILMACMFGYTHSVWEAIKQQYLIEPDAAIEEHAGQTPVQES